jgi:hypothetical protein
MEPNANRVFWHEDQDGDSMEIISSTPGRVTVSVSSAQGLRSPRTAYLDRTAIEGLHRVLGTWLGLNDAPATPQHLSGGPAADTPELRREAADIALILGRSDFEVNSYLIAMHLVHTLSCPARYSEKCTCGGAAPDAPAPVLAEEHRVSDNPRACDTCGHVKHGRGACVAPVGRGRHRCQCLESQEPSA